MEALLKTEADISEQKVIGKYNIIVAAVIKQIARNLASIWVTLVRGRERIGLGTKTYRLMTYIMLTHIACIQSVMNDELLDSFRTHK